MARPIQGVVHGKTIELAEDPGFADGERVEVVVTASQVGKVWGDGIRKSAGGWADYPEIDEIMERMQQERKRERGTEALL